MPRWSFQKILNDAHAKVSSFPLPWSRLESNCSIRDRMYTDFLWKQNKRTKYFPRVLSMILESRDRRMRNLKGNAIPPKAISSWNRLARKGLNDPYYESISRDTIILSPIRIHNIRPSINIHTIYCGMSIVDLIFVTKLSLVQYWPHMRTDFTQLEFTRGTVRVLTLSLNTSVRNMSKIHIYLYIYARVYAHTYTHTHIHTYALMH